MPKEGVVEQTERTMGDFLWMPDVVSPMYDILKSVASTFRVVFAMISFGFFAMVWWGLFMDFRAQKVPVLYAAIGPLIAILVMLALLFIVVVFFSSMVSPIDIFGYPIVHTYPGTCPPTHPELNGLLCYKPCPSGRHRVGDVCWADSVENGLGTAIGLEPCPDGWETWPLTCRHPISFDPIDTSHFPWTGGGAHGGETIGRLDHGGVCPGPQDAGGLSGFDDWYKRWKAAHDKKQRTKKTCNEPAGVHDGERTCEEQKLVDGAPHVERIDGMCYKSCPSGMTHVPLMPYLCVRTEADGTPMRLDYYDADSKVPSMVQLFGFINPF